MNELQVFEKAELGRLRVAEIDGKETFNLNDVCVGLGYTKSDGNKLYLRKDKIDNICQSLGIVGLSLGDRESYQINKDIDFENTYISEESFYDFCLESKAKHARMFRKWVTSEVLPSIRKHGAYATSETLDNILNNPEFGIRLLSELKKERDEKAVLQEENEILKPKAELADTLTSADNLMNFIEVADIFKVCGRNTLMKILREDDILMSGDFTKNIPRSQYIKNGYFSVIVTPRKTNEGMKNITTTLCKPKALKLVHKVLKERDLLIN